MRIYILFIVGLLFLSCQLDAEDDNFHLEKIPAFDIQVPQNLVVNFEYTISYKYALINGCYSFYDGPPYSNTINNNIREITALAKVMDDWNCTDDYRVSTHAFSFKPTESKTYVFRFWTRQNDQGIDEFDEFELVVE